MKILVTGGSGFVGRHLLSSLIAEGHEMVVTTRNLSRAKERLGALPLSSFSVILWPVSDVDFINHLMDCEAVINLAGEGIADKRWSDKRKKQLRESRIDFTEQLISMFQNHQVVPKVWVNASAIGYYGTHDETVHLSESSSYGTDFSAELCRDWEAALEPIHNWGCRVVVYRFGVVLGEGGMIAKLKPSFMLGGGAILGNGRQGLSWVHMDDLLDALLMSISHDEVSGIYNLTAPKPVSNYDFTKALAKAMRRPAFLTMPAAVMHLMLGELADTLLLSGQWVYPDRLEAMGFQFKYQDIETALEQIIR